MRQSICACLSVVLVFASIAFCYPASSPQNGCTQVDVYFQMVDPVEGLKCFHSMETDCPDTMCSLEWSCIMGGFKAFGEMVIEGASLGYFGEISGMQMVCDGLDFAATSIEYCYTVERLVDLVVLTVTCG